MEEWDWDKNNALGLFPDKLTCGTTRRVWWKCKKCGHEWMTSIGHRAYYKKPTICPKCAANDRSKIRQENLRQTSNVAKKYPFLMEEWNFEKNTISPEKITKGSHDLIWWKCKYGHEWKTSVGNRIKMHKCPYCSGRFAIKGVNDLETINPTLAKEWNYEKNGKLKPCDVKFASNKKVWWICKHGHEWEATIVNRNKKRGCPFCSQSRRISVPEKALYFYLSKVFFVEQNKKICSKRSSV